MKTVDQLNLYIYAMWRRKCIELGSNLPLPSFIRPFREQGLLIVGMNPSFNKGGYKRELSKSEYEWIRNCNYNELIMHDYKLQLTKGEILKLIEIVHMVDKAIGDGGHIYIKTLKEKIVDKTNVEMGSLLFWDLFCFRENEQDVFLKKYIYSTYITKGNNQKVKLNLFGLKQIVILLKVIELNKPKVIVLPNKGAADQLMDVLKSNQRQFGFKEDYGTHYIKVKKKEYPIFLSSNLHLRSRVDRYSQDRLGWHINRVFNRDIVDLELT